ncbi:hypothetical protein [Streptomyces sp. NPDC059874]|uniref:hypothetical protein n=1 Tax=Streptomyces sp. NPDC059874 TaxID=3346983 RepID=UPI003653ABA2
MTLLSDQADGIRALVATADPGAVWAVGDADGVHAGSHPLDDGDDDIGAGADVGGLLGVLALWPVVGSLVEEGALRLHTPLAVYGDTDAPAGTTAHHLLTHPGGTAALTRLAERLAGSPLGELAAARIWRPLGMAGTRFADSTLYAPPADLVRFLRHLLSPAPTPQGTAAISRTWTTESLRIRTGELTPARGLLWHPAPHGVWTHPAPTDHGPTLWISPRLHRWAILLPTAAARQPLRSAFREAAFARTGARGLPGWDVR